MTASKKKPARKSATARPAKPNSFFSKENYSGMVHGLVDQGLERDDAIETLKVGLREANGLPIPLELRRVDA